MIVFNGFFENLLHLAPTRRIRQIPVNGVVPDYTRKILFTQPGDYVVTDFDDVVSTIPIIQPMELKMLVKSFDPTLCNVSNIFIMW